MFKRFRVQVLLRLAAILLVALLLAYLIVWTTYYEAMVIVAGVFVYFMIALVRYVEKTTRDLTRFLQAIRYSDFSQGFVSGERGPVFNELSERFDEVVAEFKKLRADKEEQVRYLQNVIRHVGIALVAFTEDGSVEFANEAAKRLLDTNRLAHIEEFSALGDDFVKRIHKLESGERVVIHAEGESRSLQLAVYATRFTLRGELHTLLSIQDITHELEEKEMGAWQQLTRVLTHEIMNSVAPISSLAATAGELVSDGAMSQPESERESDVREALDVIQRRSESLIHFIDAYRTFTKIPTPDFELVPVSDLFQRVIRLMKSEAGEVQVTSTIQPKTLQLTADPRLIEQVLINLVINALHAVDRQPGAEISLTARVDRRGIPIIQVIDNGPGIPPDVQERIFVPFFTTKEEGSGIGLSLSRQIMRLHGGSISVHCSDQHTTFTLRF